MCGIAGIVSTSRPDVGLVHRMCDVIAHRGPDGSGFHDDDHAALGMRRLAIIDVAGGRQPVANEDGSVVAVFNGELYNFAELRAGLIARGHRLRSDGDSECLVHLYEEYGAELVHRLRGMFAFAIWDTRREQLLLARDRVGKKPLYWSADGTSLRFGSELKCLVQDPAVSRTLDLVAMHHYLTYQYVPAPWSIYEGISKLPPGHLLVWRAGQAKVRPYWRLDFTPRAVTDEGAEAQRLRDLLLDAVRVRMVSERPLGAFLSGGIDSSAVVAAMAMSSGERVKTFSIGFDDPEFDERDHARAVADRYGTEHHELVVNPRALAVLPDLAWHFDEPFADSSAIPSFYVARMSRERVTVILNGDGGDESFGGYRRYVYLARLGRLPVAPLCRPSLARLGAGMAAGRRPGSARDRAGRALQLLGEPVSRRYGRLMARFSPEQKAALYTDAVRDHLAGVDSGRLLDEEFARSRADTAVGRAIDADVHTYLPGDLLVKADLTTMANSLEARSPFLDHVLMEWAAGLPTRLKLRGDTTKYLLRRAVSPWLPPQLSGRPKRGFGVPLGSWLRGDLRDLAHDVLTDGTARSRGLFRPDAVAALLRAHDEGTDHASRIWALIQFELWHRMFLDAPTAPSRPGHRLAGVRQR
jgi:asparagine synthase (glutamine-hydrolysing)